MLYKVYLHLKGVPPDAITVIFLTPSDMIGQTKS